MPELPEVEAICARAATASSWNITGIEITRNNGRYFPDGLPIGCSILNVRRIGKWVVFSTAGGYICCHNAMSGYWDLASDPWTFDYVEGVREPSDSDVRVRIILGNRDVLRFHDLRLFGRIGWSEDLPKCGPELMHTPLRHPSTRVISSDEFAVGLRSRREPIKHVLMDQGFLAGIGNIYSNEALHLSGIDPIWPACSLSADQMAVLLEALRCTVSLCIPNVRYDWLNVYRRKKCRTCAAGVYREVLRGRATFSCPRCQWEPTP